MFPAVLALGLILAVVLVARGSDRANNVFLLATIAGALTTAAALMYLLLQISQEGLDGRAWLVLAWLTAAGGACLVAARRLPASMRAGLCSFGGVSAGGIGMLSFSPLVLLVLPGILAVTAAGQVVSADRRAIIGAIGGGAAGAALIALLLATV
jgi:hypothetical protein